MFDNLSEENILLYAAKNYDKPNCIRSEFEEDYKKIRYIKRLLQRYRSNGRIKERLILNHLVVIQNVFGVEGCVRILFYKLNKDLHSYLKAFLEYLQYLPYEIPEADIHGIHSDHRIAKILQRIK